MISLNDNYKKIDRYLERLGFETKKEKQSILPTYPFISALTIKEIDKITHLIY